MLDISSQCKVKTQVWVCHNIALVSMSHKQLSLKSNSIGYVKHVH